MQNIILKNMKTNSSGTVFIFLMAKLYLRRRNLNYKRECELWHYEDWKTSRYRKWERNVQHKQIRSQTKIELSKAINEYFETE